MRVTGKIYLPNVHNVHNIVLKYIYRNNRRLPCVHRAEPYTGMCKA